MKPDRQHLHGFSLIELVIVTVILGIMSALLAPMMFSSLRAYDYTLKDVETLDKLRYATERLAREIREVQYASSMITPATDCGDSPATTDHYCFSAMNANSLAFRRSYLDATGGVVWRTVTISTTSTPSASCIAAPCVMLAYSDMAGIGAQVLTDELGATGNLAFAYFREDGSTAATLAGNTNCVISNTCAHYIEISLTLLHNNNNYSQRTRIELRNAIL